MCVPSHHSGFISFQPLDYSLTFMIYQGASNRWYIINDYSCAIDQSEGMDWSQIAKACWSG